MSVHPLIAQLAGDGSGVYDNTAGVNPKAAMHLTPLLDNGYQSFVTPIGSAMVGGKQKSK